MNYNVDTLSLRGKDNIQMNEDKDLRIIIDEYTDEKLKRLEEKYKLTRLEIVKKSIEKFDVDLVTKLFGTDMMDAILAFDGAYTLNDFGIAGKNYIEGRGFWLDVHANFDIRQKSGFKYGTICVKIDNTKNNLYIDSGFINDIHNILAIIYSSK